jgi:TetR/AcrR family transcriptional regulator, cholesterol catabolism regulator
MEYVITLGRRERKREAIHQRLLDISEKLFRERGLTRTTVDDIAEAADVARQTFFNHFPYKEALALELVSQEVQEVAHRAQALLESGVSALEVLKQAADWVFEAALKDGELAVAVARELLHSDPGRATRAAQQVPLCQIFEAILVQAREEGTLRIDIPPDVIAARMSGMLRSVIAQVLCADAEKLRRELSFCFEIVFNGIVHRSKQNAFMD